MNRIPLSLPAKNAPDTPLVRLCRALGTHPYVVALSALGWQPVPWCYKRDGGDDLTWFIDSDVPRAHELMARCELPAGAPKSLIKSAPDSPFLGAICALETVAALREWGRTGTLPEFERCGYFFRPAAKGEVWPAGLNVATAFIGFTYTAAIIASGFLPWPALGSHGNDPLVGFARESLTFPGLCIEDIQRVLQADSRAAIHAPRSLPGYPAEEHPFFYALQAVMSLPGFQEAQTVAEKHPRVVLKSKNSPASVIATAAAMTLGRKDTEAFRDKVRKHLKKSAPKVS